jgi:hypothetical protein
MIFFGFLFIHRIIKKSALSWTNLKPSKLFALCACVYRVYLFLALF